MRYTTLLEAQKLVVPALVRKYLGLRSYSILKPMIGVYKLSRKINADKILKSVLFPSDYKQKILALDVAEAGNIISNKKGHSTGKKPMRCPIH